MKKVFIGVLAALMLFAFTACEQQPIDVNGYVPTMATVVANGVIIEGQEITADLFTGTVTYRNGETANVPVTVDTTNNTASIDCGNGVEASIKYSVVKATSAVVNNASVKDVVKGGAGNTLALEDGYTITLSYGDASVTLEPSTTVKATVGNIATNEVGVVEAKLTVSVNEKNIPTESTVDVNVVEDATTSYWIVKYDGKAVVNNTIAVEYGDQVSEFKNKLAVYAVDSEGNETIVPATVSSTTNYQLRGLPATSFGEAATPTASYTLSINPVVKDVRWDSATANANMNKTITITVSDPADLAGATVIATPTSQNYQIGKSLTAADVTVTLKTKSGAAITTGYGVTFLDPKTFTSTDFTANTQPTVTVLLTYGDESVTKTFQALSLKAAQA